MAEKPARPIPERDAMRDALRRDGRRMTVQRAMLLRIIEESQEHLDAETIHRRARDAGSRMNLSTVYRNLKVLAQMGFLRELHFDEEHHHFERALGEHCHLYCLKCGRVIEYWPPDGDRRLHEAAEMHGFELVSARLELQGFCQLCRASQRGHPQNREAE